MPLQVRGTTFRCLCKLLKPVARFCVRHAHPIQDLIEAAKVALIEVAAEEMRRQHHKVNVSRMSVITGVHRRDVMRIAKEGRVTESTSGLTGRILGQWEQDPRFQTKEGKPRVLSIDGANNEFRDLVHTVSQDLNYGTILFDLERIGAVQRTARGIKLKSTALSVKADLEGSMEMISNDSEDLLRCVEENVLRAPTVPHLHARTEYDNVPPQYLPNIRSWILEEGTRFHARVREYVSQFDRDINPAIEGPGRAKIMVGAFSRAEERSND